jgi:type I restriction enzyme, S subunit
MTGWVTAHLPLVADAPDGIKVLRQLVIDLAICGRLMPQKPDDGTGADLLCSIESSRLARVHSGAIKEPKTVPEVSIDEAPFPVPDNWSWTRLGRITNYGSTTKEVSIPEDAWLLDLEDIEKDTSRLLRKARFADRQSLSDKNVFSDGDLLYCKLRPYLNKVIVADERGYCTTEILPFRCYGDWSPHYFKYALKSSHFLGYVNAKSYGMKMPRLGTEDGRMALIPLPPVSEQHRIVAKVDELMALCDRLEADQADAQAAHAQLVQALLGSLTQATDAADFRASWQRLSERFHTLFTTEASIVSLENSIRHLALKGKLSSHVPGDESAVDLLDRIKMEREMLVRHGEMRKAKDFSDVQLSEMSFDIPNGWAWARLGNIINFVNGFAFKSSDFGDVGRGVVKIGDIQNGHISIKNMSRIDASVAVDLDPRLQVMKGDLLIAMSGATTGKIGFNFTDEVFYLNQRVGKIDPILISKKFIALDLETKVVENLAKSFGSAIPNLSTEQIGNIVIALPPLAEQHRIVAKVDELMALCDQLKAQLAEARQQHAQLASVLVEQAVAAH